MFISENLCFIEFGKTGCSFIREVLNRNVKSGQLTKIHDQITDDLLHSKKLKVGSIRSPLDWYISLWSFGCLMKKKDPLFSNLTSFRLNPKRLKNIKGNLNSKFQFFFDQFRKDINYNKDLYSDSYNIKNFRKWIKLMFDIKKKNFISEQYSISNLNKFLGYMSFHYLIKFTDPRYHYKLFNGSLKNLNDVKGYLNQHNFINYFIIFENLDNSLINLFNKIGLTFDKNKIFEIKPINKSNRFSKIDDYYDFETKEMVKHFDGLIFSHHEYKL